MLVKDVRYIIKRIIIGVGIALVLAFLRGNLFTVVNAQTISSYNMGSHTDVVTNVDRILTYYTNSNPWYSQGDGYLTFTFSITKVLGDSTAPNVQPKFVTVSSGPQSFACNVGSTSMGNSTFNQSLYSATCPVFMTSSGLEVVSIGLQDNQQNSQSSYRVYFQGWLTFEQKAVDTDIDYNNILGSINANANANAGFTQQAINSASSNIINNQNSNFQSVINNQNQIAQQQEENQKVCNSQQTSNSLDIIDNKVLDSSGVELNNSYYVISKYYEINDDTIIKVINDYGQSSSWNSCFYNLNKELLSCINIGSLTIDQILNIPNGARYFRSTLYKTRNIPLFEISTCKNGNQALAEQNQQLQNTLNDTSTTDSENNASNFFGNFSSNSHGLSGIISSPLRLIQSISSSSCSPLSVPLPFVNQNVSLPCMSTIYTTHFNAFLVIYRLITTGLIAYWVCVRLFSKVKDFQNPDNDRIEVLDL